MAKDTPTWITEQTRNKKSSEKLKSEKSEKETKEKQYQKMNRKRTEINGKN